MAPHQRRIQELKPGERTKITRIVLFGLKPYFGESRGSLMLIQVALLVLLLFLVPSAAQCHGSISSSEYQALYSLFNATNGTHWAWRNETDTPGKPWMFNTTSMRYGDYPQEDSSSSSSSSSSYLSDPCMQPWQGLNCSSLPSASPSQCYISAINLPASNLRGQLPEALGNLRQLESLFLSVNFLTGRIPSILGSLAQLMQLSLARNLLSGTIPSTLGSLPQLLELYLFNNSLTGPIPSTLASLEKLKRLYLEINSLTGPIPSALGDLPQLEQLVLFSNSLNGSIPSALGSLAQLELLSLGSNYLTGPIPSSLGNLTQLVGLFLNTNSLTGSIPCSLGGLSQLYRLILAANLLTGPIPSILGDLSQLGILYLAGNALTGPIPSTLGALVQLDSLFLYANQLTGPIPSILGTLKYLVDLFLYDNCLSGPIPSVLGNLSLLEELYLDTNFLTGPIPSTLGSPTSLVYLFLNANALSGPIPSTLGSLRGLTRLDLNTNLLMGPIPSNLGNLLLLEYLYLNFNSLTGTVPSDLGKLTRLEYLYLNYNSLSETIPSSLGLLKRMLNFYVNSNSLHGNLEVSGLFSGATSNFPLLVELDIADNAFSGSFPADLFSRATLQVLAASSNCFSGQLAMKSNNASKSRLKTLLMDGLSSGQACRNYVLKLPEQLVANPGYIPLNYMTGSIPASIWSLPELKKVSLLGNGFMGPLDLGSFDPSTSALEKVTLAYNRLSGTVPAALQEYGRLQYFDISNNKFSGTLSANLAFNSSFASAFNVSVNRLSGPFPTGQDDLLNVPNVINNVLLGNLFTSDVDFSFGTAFQDGSTELNIAIANAAVVPVALVFLWIVIKADLPQYCSTRLVSLRDIVHRWMLHGCSRKNLHTRRFFAVVSSLMWSILAMLVAILALGVLLVLLKSFETLSGKYATYQFQYGWTFSAVYLHDLTPMILCSACICATSVLLGYVFAPDSRSESAGDSTNLAVKSVKMWAKFFLIWLLNAAVMLTLNGLYLSAVLNNDPYLVPIQAAIGMFKFGWNQVVALMVTSRIASSTGQRSVGMLLLTMQIFTFVVAPCIATLLSDSNCFYELFEHEPAQGTTSLGQCLEKELRLIDGSYSLQCTATSGSTSLAQPFNPPFIYHYGCSSALIVNYVPVLLYVFLLMNVGSFAAIFMCLRFRAAIEHCVPSWIIEEAFPRLYLVDSHSVPKQSCVSSHPSNHRSKHEDSDQGFHLDTPLSQDYPSSDILSIVDPCHGSLRQEVVSAGAADSSANPREQLASRNQKPLFRGGLFMNKLTLHVLVMLTFGMAAPYLAFIVVCSFFAELTMIRLLVGRFLWISASGSPSTSSGSPCSGSFAPASTVSLFSGRDSVSSGVTEIVVGGGGGPAVLGGGGGGGGSFAADTRSLSIDVGGDEEEAKVEAIHSLIENTQLSSVRDSSQLLAAALCEVDEALEGVWAYPNDGMWLVVLVAQVFWAQLFFDMIGDVYGFEAGLQAMAATILCLPLLTYWLVRIALAATHSCDPWAWLQRKTSGLSFAAGSFGVAIGSEALSFKTDVDTQRATLAAVFQDDGAVEARTVSEMNSHFVGDSLPANQAR